MPAKPIVHVVIHSFYGHTKSLGEAIVAGLESEGAVAKLFRVPETLPAEVLAKMHAATFDNIPVITPDDLTKADGFLFGFGGRFGGAPAQVKAFWDSTGGLWATGALAGKFGGAFTSTATQHGGQETNIFSFLPNYVHHGIIFVPLGFGPKGISGVDEVTGGTPWGASAIADSNGSRAVTDREKQIAKEQGIAFAKTLKRLA
ncbi:hypothetical protein HDU79_007102 [Rhizoclosmatium sp. JEL0117]|nr:hypothetical protein HDU79_007102 [Rhizoclosmatium sp. JEL0117]